MGGSGRWSDLFLFARGERVGALELAAGAGEIAAETMFEQRQGWHGVPCRGLFALRAGLDDGATGQTALFFGDGFGVDEPLAVAGAAGLLLL